MPASFRNFIAPGKGIRIGGLSPEFLASKFTTPFYAYDASLIRIRYEEFKNSLPFGTEVCYLARANSNISILSILCKEGASVSAASIGEMMAAAKAGYKYDKIFFSSTAKTQDEIKYAMEMGAILVAGSARDAEKISEQASSMKRKQKIGLRVNPPMHMEGQAITDRPGTKLGVDDDKVVAAIKSLPIKQAEVCGLYFASAAGVLNAAILVDYVKKCLDIANAVEKEAGITLEWIQIGLGIGIPNSESEKDFDAKAFGGLLGDDFVKKGRRIIFETGTYLVAESAVYCTKILEMKESRGRKFILTDGGIHHYMRHALMEKAALVYLSTKPTAKAEIAADICGVLSMDKDTLAKNVLLPKVSEGDVLVFMNAGAYGYAEAMPFFESRRAPVEIMVDGPRTFLIRKSITEEEMLKTTQGD